MRRFLAIIVAIAILAFAGCGGGGSSSSSSSTAATSTTASTGTSAAPRPRRGQGPAEKKNPPPPPKPKDPAPTAPHPLPNQGTKVVAPGVPTVHGGDNSIQRYGVESQSSEREEAALIAQAYLKAQAAGRWSEACAYLNAKTRSGFEALAEKAQSPSAKGCAGAMATLFAKVPQAALQSAAEIHVISFRVEGDQAFVVYRDGTGKPFNLPMNREGEEWRVGALDGIGLVL